MALAMVRGMKNTKSTKGFAVGSVVVLSDEYTGLFESTPDLRNVLCEVVDARLAFQTYVYTVAPIGAQGPQLARAVECYACDLRAVAA